MTDTTAKIRAKGLDATGVTEEIASQYYAAKGRHFMFIGEYKVDETHDKADGTHKVDLVITQVEPATELELENHLRQLTRTLHQNRTLHADDQQLTIDTADDLEPTVEGVIAAGQQHIATTDDELPNPDDDQGDEDHEDAQECGTSVDHIVPAGETQCLRCDAEVDVDDQDDVEVTVTAAELDAATEDQDDTSGRVVAFSNRS